MTQKIEIAALYRYPVKGLSPQALAHVQLDRGATFPADRIYAIENGPSRFDAAEPKHVQKTAFLMLMRDERLAALQTDYDEVDHVLTISRGGKPVTRGDLRTKPGRALIEQFMAAYMKAGLRGPPRILSAPDHSFSDVAEKCVHIINLATLAELERVMERRFDPLRFRPNIVLQGAPPWVEFGWIGSELRLGTSGLRLDVFQRVTRCAATNVDPATGARDADIPAALDRRWGHHDFGVYARVAERGRIAVGDTVTPPHP